MQSPLARLGLTVLALALLACAGQPPSPAPRPPDGPAPGQGRFSTTSAGTIIDRSTGLEWIVGPDRDIILRDAERWLRECQVSGGGWRLPTMPELRGLHIPGAGEINLAPVFPTSGFLVWAEPPSDNPLRVWYFNFQLGQADWYVHGRHEFHYRRVFGVRPAQDWPHRR